MKGSDLGNNAAFICKAPAEFQLELPFSSPRCTPRAERFIKHGKVEAIAKRK